MVFENINWNSGDIILTVNCLHCCNLKATIIGSIKVYDWLTSSEYSNLSKIKLLIPELIFSIKSSECSVCIHCDSNPTNICWKCFLEWTGFVWQEWWKSLLESSNNELYKSVSKHVHSFLVIIILESNTTSVKWTINNSKTNVGVANHVEIRSGSD